VNYSILHRRALRRLRRGGEGAKQEQHQRGGANTNTAEDMPREHGRLLANATKPMPYGARLRDYVSEMRD